MRPSTKSSLTRRLDAICSKIVRSRGMCCRCGNKRYEELQCAHIFGRKLRSTRWDLDNLLCLCWSCHAWFGDRPTIFGEFVISKMGKEKYGTLKIKAHTLNKWMLWEMQELLEQYENSFHSK